MKKIIFAFAAMFIFAATSNAAVVNTNPNSATTKYASQNNIHLGNITGMSLNEIEAKVLEAIGEQALTDLNCSVTVKGELDLGFITFEISVTVSGPCAEVQKSGRKIALDLLQQVKAYLEEVF